MSVQSTLCGLLPCIHRSPHENWYTGGFGFLFLVIAKCGSGAHDGTGWVNNWGRAVALGSIAGNDITVVYGGGKSRLE